MNGWQLMEAFEVSSRLLLRAWGAATSRVGRKILGLVTATTFMALAYKEAKATGMSNAEAAAYATASIAGGDVIYEGMNAAGHIAWAKTNAFARSSAGGRVSVPD